MKLFRILILLFAWLGMTGCVNEDLDDCNPSDNVTLRFSYKGDGSSELFPEKIDKVDLFVFDEGGVFLQSVSLSESDLSEFSGTHLTLTPGFYRVVCWGNAFDRSDLGQFITGLSTLNSASLNHVIPGSGFARTSDSLYYAPRLSSGANEFSFQVANSFTKLDTTINFRSAHTNVRVYTTGFDEKDNTGKTILPDIELQNLPSKYNYSMVTFGTNAKYTGEAQNVIYNNKMYAFTGFKTFRFPDDNPVLIAVKSKTNNKVLVTVNLKDFMAEHNISVKNIDQVTIPVLIEYKNAVVTVSLPGWEELPVKPEF